MPSEDLTDFVEDIKYLQDQLGLTIEQAFNAYNLQAGAADHRRHSAFHDRMEERDLEFKRATAQYAEAAGQFITKHEELEATAAS